MEDSNEKDEMANMEPIKVKYWRDQLVEHPDFTGCLINNNNDKAWFKNGLKHREDGQPAVECAKGYNNNSYKAWFKNGQRHREDGPAIEFADGSKRWHLNDKYYSEQDWKIALRKIKLERVLKKING